MELNQSLECLVHTEPKSWTKKCTNLEKCLVLILCFGGCTVVACVVNVVIRSAGGNCSTRSCIKIAAEVIKHIDSNVEPCSNFYKFTCGKLINTTHKKQASTRTLKNQIQKQVDILSEPIDEKDHIIIGYEKKLYNACINESEGAESFKMFKTILKDLDGWPVLDGSDWNENKFNLEEMIGKLRKNGLKYWSIISIYPTKHPTEHSKKIINLRFPFLLTNSRNQQYYLKVMTDVAIVFGANESRAAIEMFEVYGFMMELAKLGEEYTKINNTKLEISRDQLKSRRIDEIDWLTMINNVLDPVIELNANDAIILPNSDFLRNLDKLLKNTSKRVLANYVLWYAIDDLLPFLLHNFQKIYNEYRCLLDLPSRTPYDTCKTAVRNSFGPLPAYFSYAKKHLTPETKKKARHLYEKIKNEFGYLLLKLNIDPISKIEIKELFDTIEEVIGIKEDNVDNLLLEKLFKGHIEPIEGKGFLKMYLYFKWKIENLWVENFRLSNMSSADFLIYYDIPSTVPSYIKDARTFVLPVGLLHNMFYDDNKPMYTFFATLGRRIGISLFNIINEDQITAEDSARVWSNLINITFINTKYKQVFPDEELMEEYRKKIRTDKLIAEQLGIKVAYDAYQKWVIENQKESSVIRLHYTPNQLFWIYSMSELCFEEDSDLLTFYQNNVVVSENSDFINDFQCSTKIFITNKCNVP